MALGRQVSTSSTLLTFCAWAAAAGYRLGEHPRYGGVSNVHVRGSWHYDGLAVDVNYGPPGTSSTERRKLLTALEVAESMGLGVIHARDGRVGSARTHTGHLHVDVGPTSNYGRGLVPVKSGSLVPHRLQGAVNFRTAERDNLWGPNTDARLEAVRHASRHHGVKFPHGVELAQRAVGTKVDGRWGDNSRAEHDETVGEVQRALGVKVDHVWGPKTDAAYLAARRRYRR